jgi:protein O-GlcNAc transferase
MTAFQARDLYTACPLCSSSDFVNFKTASCRAHPLFQPPLPEMMQWRQCRACSHVFTEGYFTKAASDILFSRALPHQEVGYQLEEQRYLAGRVLERVRAQKPRGAGEGAWLDVGFGNGALLFAAAEWGYHPVGLDLRQSEVAKLKSVGIEAHCQDISRLDHPGRYAVISMADVIEHMPFPATALMAADRLLAPDGLLVISTPNSGSPTWDLMTKFDANPYWGEIEHYHNFSRQRLTAFLEEFGFQVIHFAVAERYKLGMEIIAKRMEAFDDQTDVD